MYHYMENGQLDEEGALDKCRELFEQVPKTRNKKVIPEELRKMFTQKLKDLGGYEGRRWGQRKKG